MATELRMPERHLTIADRDGDQAYLVPESDPGVEYLATGLDGVVLEREDVKTLIGYLEGALKR